MPGCAARNCKNSNAKGFRLFVFPTQKERRKKWIENCGMGAWTPSRYSRLCEVHFEADQFELKRQDGWRKLKQTAVPTLFDVPDSQELVTDVPNCQNLLIIVPNSQELIKIVPNSQDLDKIVPNSQKLVPIPNSQELVPIPNSQELDTIIPNSQDTIVPHSQDLDTIVPHSQDLVTPQMKNACVQIDLSSDDDLEEESDSPHGKTASAFDDESESFVVDNPEPELEIRNKEIPPPKLQCPAQQFVVIDPPKQKRVFLQPKRILHNRVNCFDASSAASTTTTAIRTRTKREHSPESGSSTNNNNDTTDEGLIIGETYTTLKDGERKRDEFDAYGEYIAKLLRSLDRSTRAFLKKDFGEAIFKAESGFYAFQFNSQNCTQQYSRPSAVNYSPQTSRVPSPKSPTIITGSQDVDVNQHILPAHEPASQQLELVWGNPNC